MEGGRGKLEKGQGTSEDGFHLLSSIIHSPSSNLHPPSSVLMKTLEEMPVAEYEAVVERFIEEASRWDGSLPVETFFEVWAAIERRKETVEVQACIEDDRLVLTAPPDSPLTVQDNRIWLEDGRQVVLKLISARASAG